MPINILHGADLHLDLRRYGHPTASGNSRVDDFTDTLQRYAETAVREQADLAILAGDTFDTRTPSIPALTALSRAVASMRDAGVQVVVCPGNHDGAEIIGEPSTHTLGWVYALDLPGVWVPLVPGIKRIETRSGPVDVTAVPYPHKRALDAELEGVDPEDRVIEAARRVDALIESLAPAPARDAPAVFVGHLSVTGSRLGSERMMRHGWDVTINADRLALWDYAALGHIHYQQRVNQRTWYAGSMEYIDFAEQGAPKGWLKARVEAGGSDPDVQPIPSGARPLGVLDIRQTPDGQLLDTTPASWYERGPIIRLRLLCDYRRPTAGEQAKLRDGVLAKGASYVETEIVLGDAVAEQRATRPAVDAAVAAVLAESESAGGEEAPRATVADLTMAEALKVWLTANERQLEPTLTIGTRMIAEHTAEGRTA